MRTIEKMRIAVILGLSTITSVACSSGSFGEPDGETTDIAIAENIEVGQADAKSQAIVAAAQAFLDTLTDAQRKSVVYAFDNNAQRARWSNFPISFVERGGIMRKNLGAEQNAALDALLAQVLSTKGVRNAKLQMVADDALIGGDGPQADFGNGFYYVAFLGQPSAEAPWMFQFGGHHLAINVTFVGPKASFSPMLTGGQPLTVDFEGQKIYITREEVEAGQAFLASLNTQQKSKAVRGSEAINLLSGPGEYGTIVAPEGVRGSALTDQQKDLLLAVVEARIGQFNARDAAAKMAAVRSGLNDTYFGWWGPQNKLGEAYFRISGPEIFMEYGPQSMGDGDPAEHAHNMYRDPTNDYGAKWIKAK